MLPSTTFIFRTYEVFVIDGFGDVSEMRHAGTIYHDRTNLDNDESRQNLMRCSGLYLHTLSAGFQKTLVLLHSALSKSTRFIHMKLARSPSFHRKGFSILDSQEPW
jgi:hypothetical protein